MPVVQDFGVVTAITVFFSLVLALVLLPVFLVLDSQSRNGDSNSEARIIVQPVADSNPPQS
jgi:multidrug efflux pump subunit AcrB